MHESSSAARGIAVACLERVAERILVVDDEKDVCRLLAFNLERAGFEVRTVLTAAEALLAVGRFQPIVVVLDLMLPDLPGLDVCRRLRAAPSLGGLGILVLSALGSDDDRVGGLEVGADDYVVKPFNVREVILRVGALARRIREQAETQPSPGGLLRSGALTVNPRTHDVRSGERPLALRPLEFKLLVTLMSSSGEVLSRADLLERVWDISAAGNPRMVDVHVRRLRQNLGDCADVIETVPGFGYRARER